MIKIKTIPHKEGGEFHVYEVENCHMINPYVHFQNSFFTAFYHINVLKYFDEYDKLTFSGKIALKFRIQQISTTEVKERIKTIRNTPLQHALIELLQETKKKRQQSLLKGVRFHSPLFVALALYAWDTHKMPYTKVISDYLPKEFNEADMPAYIHLKEDGELEHPEDVVLSQGQMKAVLEKRNRVIADIIGDDVNWHCFFRTMSGIRGHEHPHKGEPHLHYISSAWGFSRQRLIEQLSSYRYSLDAETIPFD